VTLEPITSSTITDVQILKRELEIVRQRGYAESVGERVVGATGLSAPIFDVDGRILAALSILGPETRLTASKSLEYVPAIQETATSISALLASQY
jgi:DNA-binding IclR family transcriptional regulator